MKLSEVIAQIGERELSLWAELCEGLLRACEETGTECSDEEPLASAMTPYGTVLFTAGLVREMRAAGMTCACGIMGESADLAEHTASCAKVRAASNCGWCLHPASIGPCPRWVTRDGIPEPCDCDDPCHKVGGVRA